MFEEITEGLHATARGAKDASGKTPLDRAIERLKLDSEVARSSFAQYLSELFPALIMNGPEHLKMGRYIIRRLGIKDRSVADALRLLLADRLAKKNREVRLWLMLALMDLGFPPTVAALSADDDLRKNHTGEWLTLVSSNESYADVKDAFVRAASDKLLNERLLVLKVDGIRRQFGHKLFDFLSSLLPLLTPQDRTNAIVSMQKMYGINLAETGKAPDKGGGAAPASGLSSFSAKTIRVLETVGADAERRAERRQVA